MSLPSARGGVQAVEGRQRRGIGATLDDDALALGAAHAPQRLAAGEAPLHGLHLGLEAHHVMVIGRTGSPHSGQRAVDPQLDPQADAKIVQGRAQAGLSAVPAERRAQVREGKRDEPPTRSAGWRRAPAAVRRAPAPRRR